MAEISSVFYKVSQSGTSKEGGFLQGKIIFTVAGAEKNGRTMDSGWLFIPVSRGPHFFSFAQMVSVGDPTFGADHVMVFQGGALLEKTIKSNTPLLKVSGAFRPDTSELRVLVRSKRALQDGTYVIAWMTEYDEAAEAEAVSEDQLSLSDAELPQDAPQSAAEQAAASSDNSGDTAFYLENVPKVLHLGWKWQLRAHVPSSLQPQSALDTSVVSWAVKGAGSCGTIDRYGCYTAPDHAGVFEVTAVLEPTGQTTSAFMIVRA